MGYDFDEMIDRRGSGSYKWDAHSTDDPDTIEMWVADMDFRTAPEITDALRRRVDHGIFGYTQVPDSYFDALTGWFGKRHGYEIDRNMVIYTSGVVPALSAVIKALVAPGEGVIIQAPAYNCFYSSIRNNGCRVVENRLIRNDLPDGRFTYRLDFCELERLAADASNTALLLCNPHNPSGRIWTADELRRISEICRRNNVTVISDEIHCELIMPGLRYNPFALIDKTAIICNSPSKAFNTAGLQIANIVAPDEATRRRIDRAININEVCDVNPFGVAGLIAAYGRGEAWLDSLRDYLAGNYSLLADMFAKELPMFPHTRIEATYLVWVDISAAGRGADCVEQELAGHHHVRISSGSIYGDDRYVRINIACPKRRLAEGLRRIATGLKSLTTAR